jgi:hypothetical protein
LNVPAIEGCIDILNDSGIGLVHVLSPESIYARIVG